MNLASAQAEKGAAVFSQNFFSELGAGLGDFREAIHPLVGPARVNDGAGVH